MLVDDDAPASRIPIQILFAASDSRSTRAVELSNELASLLGDRTRFEREPIRTAVGKLNAEVRAVVVLMDRSDDASGLAALLNGVENRGIPVLILTDAESASTSLATSWNTLPMNEDAKVVAALLRGLLSRQPEIDSLRQFTRGAENQASQLQGEVARMRDELQLAGQVQREFLPKNLADFSGGKAAALWRPMAYVGGDIYDARRLDEHHVGLFVADAVGHGVPAALLTMVIARGLPSKEITGKNYRIIPPGEALACVNRELLSRPGRTSKFASAIYGIVDLRTRLMRLAVAGHPAAIVMRGTRQMELAGAPGRLLGVFDGADWKEVEVQLHPGDRVLLHSDGFECAFPDPAEKQARAKTNPARFMEEFRALLEITEPAAMVEHIELKLDQQLLASSTGGIFPDDLTMLVFKVAE